MEPNETTVAVVILAAIAVIVFIVVPQLGHFRKALGIQDALASKGVSFFQRIRLYMLGLKTPFFNSIALGWTFLITEGDTLGAVDFEKYLPHKYAVWIATALWAIGVWSHFTGLNTAAATPPVIEGLPGALSCCHKDEPPTSGCG